MKYLQIDDCNSENILEKAREEQREWDNAPVGRLIGKLVDEIELLRARIAVLQLKNDSGDKWGRNTEYEDRIALLEKCVDEMEEDTKYVSSQVFHYILFDIKRTIEKYERKLEEHRNRLKQ